MNTHLLQNILETDTLKAWRLVAVLSDQNVRRLADNIVMHQDQLFEQQNTKELVPELINAI